MANTEGMSDEFVESLMGQQQNGVPFRGDNNNGIPGSSNSSNNRRRRVMEQRMEMEMGNQPAARVIRSSPHNNRNRQQQQQQQQPEEEEQPIPEEQPQIQRPPIVGNIIERSSAAKTNSSNNGTEQPKKRQSKFVLQRQQQQQQQQQSQQHQAANSGAIASGFPSVHVPLGTFVKRKKQPSSKLKDSTVSAARSTAIQPGQSFNLNTNTTSTKNNSNNNDNLSSLQKVAAHDANAMLDQMSPQERTENARELQASLSVETLAFLRKRAQSKTQEKNNMSQPIHSSSTNNNISERSAGTINKQKITTTTTTTQTKTTSVEQTPSEQPALTSSTKADGNSSEEKERMAKLLSKIQSEGDLDEIYRAEMGNYSPLQSSEISPDMAEQAAEDPFPLACTLLRSTSQRQNLWAAQVVCKRLQEQYDCGALCSVVVITTSSTVDLALHTPPPFSPPWPFSTMLPASLRCLLDSSASRTNGYVLHTYVLQSLYNLMRLRACPEHVVDMDRTSEPGNSATAAAAIYQEYFLEDAVPTPPTGSCYESIANIEAVDATNMPASSSTAAAAYKTGSSSTSAQKDGEAFAKDPMWTMLTRMCIIPRLAQLLKLAARQASNSGERILPKEALVAICGILAMIGQRAAGAATAIVHHKTLMKDLLELTVMPRDTAGDKEYINQPYDPVVAVPAIRLLCTVARQSRTTASSIPFDDIVPPLLAMKPSNKAQLTLQKWSVILWRTLLRYGFGLPQIPIMVTIATSHMLQGNPGADPYSLTTELSSSFANILQSLQIAQRCKPRNGNNTKEEVISEDQHEALSQADTWLTSSAHQVISQLEKLSSDSGSVEAVFAEHMRFRSGQLQLLSAFLRASTEGSRLPVDGDTNDFDNATYNVIANWMQSCQKVLAIFVKNGLLKQALEKASYAVFALDFKELRGAVDGLADEASACAFLCSFVSLQHFLLLESKNYSHEDAGSLNFVIDRLACDVSESLAKGPQSTNALKERQLNTTARRGWLNRAGFAVVELLTASMNIGLLASKGTDYVNASVLRKLQFALLGRLERGDEAMAVILFSQDSSFQASGPVADVSILSSMFFREMCRSGAARTRLDHSFKLKHGPGISHDEFGCFKLSSLLSDADVPGQTANTPDFALPVGKLWLWQVLSSSVISQPKENLKPEAIENESEVLEILSSCLALISELEDSECVDDKYQYASLIPAGGKAYHLLMLCLQPESILQNEKISELAEKLLDKYICDLQKESFGVDFARACVAHTGIAKKKADKILPKDKEEVKSEKLVSQLFDKPNIDITGQFDEWELRALEQFSGELCSAYIEYGAQYDLFTKCVRIFFLPPFPARVRGQVMRRLGDVLHLIGLPGEDDRTSFDCQQRLKLLLESSIIGGLEASRDPAEFLDAIAAVYTKAIPRIVFGYVLLLSVLLQSRHLAICLQPEEIGIEAATRRLERMHTGFVSIVIDATKRFFTSDERTRSSLVHATMTSAFDWEEHASTNASASINISEAINDLKSFA